MDKQRYSRMMYIETFLLLGFFIASVVILSSVYVRAKAKSVEAKRLTDAVTIAENVAEASISSPDIGRLTENLNAGTDFEGYWNDAWLVEKDGAKATYSFPVSEETLLVDPDSSYIVLLVWENDSGMVTADIEVSLAGGEGAIYSMSAGRYFSEGGETP